MSVNTMETVAPPAAVHRYTITSATGAWNNRDAGHRRVVSLLPDNLPGPPTVVWWPGPDGIVIHSPHPASGHPAEPLRLPGYGETLNISASVEAVASKTAHIDPRVYALLRNSGRKPSRSPRIRVGDGELHSWATALLERNGLRVEHMDAPSRSTAVRRSALLHLADINATVTVTDADAAARAVAFGIGHGKTFGAGLIRIN